PVHEANDWVNNLVIVEKKDKYLRLRLVDSRDLNKSIKRHHFKIHTLKDVKAQLSGKNILTIIDEKDGYHQVELDKKTKKLISMHFRNVIPKISLDTHFKKKKCQVKSVKYMGTIISEKGMEPAPEKIKSITEMHHQKRRATPTRNGELLTTIYS
ncbi:hypothetical protein MAR_007859, partial [Mya arenaria]